MAEVAAGPAGHGSGGQAGSLTWLGHSTVLIELDGVRLLTDPILRRRVAHLRRAAVFDPSPPTGVDAVLVSHAHVDHLDPPSLALLGRDLRVVVPLGAAGPLRRWGFRHVEQVAAGDEVRVGSLAVRATPAAHPGHRTLSLGRSGPPALGYVVAGQRRVYFAGDTDLFPAMADLAPGLDVALVPIWGWGSKLGPGHLDPRRAAQALQLLKPKVAIPIHWGTLAPLLRRARGSTDQADPAAEFRRHAEELAPWVSVQVLRPGESLEL